MTSVYICDGVRTPVGRYGGALSSLRADDLASLPLRSLAERNPQLDLGAIDEVFLGAANQAGEDNRNIARMALLLAGFPQTVPGVTVNRLCASGMDAVAAGARMIRAGEADVVVAGGAESMSRAPLVTPKADAAFSRRAEIYDTTIGWRFVNPKMLQQYGTDSMPETAENVAARFDISRKDQDAFALRSQQKTGAAINAGRLAREIIPVAVPQKKGEAMQVEQDEHPRPATSEEQLAKLPTPFRRGGTVTAGNSSGVNDGAAALLLASESAAKKHGLTPKARIVAAASAGVEPAIMGMGPVPAANKALTLAGVNLQQMDVIELNEAFAAQALACLREWNLADDDARVNPDGGAIALGHPLGMSGARLILTAARQLADSGGRYALCAMCVGVGQGVAVVLERS